MSEQAPGATDTAGSGSPDHTARAGGIDGVIAELAAVRRQLEEAERELRGVADREKLLRNEAQHRVRNMLAIIRSIFSRMVASGSLVDDMSDHFRGRLDAVARFQVGRDFNGRTSSDLEDMIRDELQNFEFDARIELGGADVAVPNEIAQMLGLAIHELATNAIKFGALSNSDAATTLRIGWTCADRLLTLNWEERGVPVLAAVPVRSGFGREFIEQALPYQASATTSFDFRPGGLICTIVIPLDQCVPPIRGW